MTPFRERNPTVIGTVGLIVVVALVVAAFRADDLPLIGGGEHYTAEFAEIGGLKSGNEVRVAGVSVGRVEDVQLDGDRVLVSFRLHEPVVLGESTSASIGIRTLLGAQYLAVSPAGPGRLTEGSTITLDRTEPPYDVVEAFSDLSRTSDELDSAQIAEALTVLGDIADRTPVEFRTAIDGLSDVSRTLAARDDELATLLARLRSVTETINSRDEQLVRLAEDGDTLFRALASRRVAVQRVLASTIRVSEEVRLLAQSTRADLEPALTRLERVTSMLRRNIDSIDQVLASFPGFGRVFSNALGNGPWFEGFIQF